MTRKQTECTELKKDSAGEEIVRWENCKDTAAVWTEQREFGQWLVFGRTGRVISPVY